MLLAGTFTFWSLVWPEGRSDKRLVVLAVTGTGLLFLGTIGGPGIEMLFGAKLPGDVLTPLSGAALLVRLAALAGVAFLLTDLVHSAVVGWRRIFALAAVVVIAGTMVTQSNAIGGRWEILKIIATSGHVLATAAWLGGLVALAAVLIPRENLQELDRLIPRFSVVATLQRDHPGDHRDRPCTGHRRGHRPSGPFPLRPGAADQGRRLRPDAAAGQPWPQVRGPGGLPPTAPSSPSPTDHCATPAACRAWRW